MLPKRYLYVWMDGFSHFSLQLPPPLPPLGWGNPQGGWECWSSECGCAHSSPPPPSPKHMEGVRIFRQALFSIPRLCICPSFHAPSAKTKVERRGLINTGTSTSATLPQPVKPAVQTLGKERGLSSAPSPKYKGEENPLPSLGQMP